MVSVALSKKIRTAGLPVVIMLTIIVLYGFTQGVNVPLALYRSWFGLTGNGTVADFRSASIGDRVYWLEHMCNSGVCLHLIDWRCGFAPKYPEFNDRVNACFTSLASRAPLSDTLDKLRLVCGRKYMVFVDQEFSTPAACVKAGGQWGKKLRLYSDENDYVE
jgi:hypothetical protein